MLRVADRTDKDFGVELGSVDWLHGGFGADKKCGGGLAARRSSKPIVEHLSYD
jgi:hypothetical protein